jgi:cobalt-zinc-cadmium resistance protein CzcA
VMTALMAMLGLLPAALSRGAGAETARPFGVVIIGGLLTGTLLTIFIVPLLYPLFEKVMPQPHEDIDGGWTPEISGAGKQM